MDENHYFQEDGEYPYEDLKFPEPEIASVHTMIGVGSLKYLAYALDIINRYEASNSLYKEDREAKEWIIKFIKDLEAREKERIETNRKNGYIK